MTSQSNAERQNPRLQSSVLLCLPFCLAFACGSSNSERAFPAKPVAPATNGDAGGPPTGSGGSGGTVGPSGTGGVGPGSSTDSAPILDGAPAPVATDAGAIASDSGGTPPSDVAVPTDVAPPSDGATAICTPQPVSSCDAPKPTVTRRRWKNGGTPIVAGQAPRHRGRDLFFAPDDPQWLIATFAYGLFDSDLTDEEVDIYLLRGCTGAWEKLATATTTRDGQHATIEGAQDTGGRIYFQVPADKRLAPGRHRVLFVVAGDGTSTEQFVEVAPRGASIAVIDIDGTLTTSETAEFGALLIGQLPTPEADAAKAVTLLVARGYRPYYLTARPEWLGARTREFLASNGFPSGILETTTGLSGALGADAVKYKTEALARQRAKGLVTGFAIGNTDTDAAAYATANVTPARHRVYLRYNDSAHGGRRFERYGDLLGELAALPPVCP